ncbi:NAD(P)H-binding protein [Marinomonas sp. 15G1-11]|uniref:NAD(P)H-binding protein n=1 Tax=Marinomonas phaeophyticola TaxID=3004091 RepID=A0ABT4JRQ7_9GAMM|nr:NAD(P)H-binding protein [Marinomonas sp. 15G1-11]MCZ2720961.1 NAD(P)H-binding protein [Marinomonas sp. 15G1-11]
MNIWKQHIAVIGGSGKLGQYMILHLLESGYKVSAVCRPQSVHKLAHFKEEITVIAAYTDDREALRKLLPEVDAVLTVLAPWGVNNYASGTAQAVLDYSPAEARLVFSCGWHISRDGKDQYSWKLKAFLLIFGKLAKWFRFADLEDQVRATDLIFSSKSKWTVVRGSDLEEGESEGLPVWAEHVGDIRIAHNKTRRVDFAKFMVAALQNNALIQKAPAIASCKKR